MRIVSRCPSVKGIPLPRIILVVLLMASGALTAQPEDQGLTSEFGKLSAKERSRIARKEQEESRNDPAYQEAMTAAEAFFQEDRYEEALERYQQARSVRPLNVYPKVKIQDIQALIEKRDKALSSAPPDTLPAPVEAVHDPPVEPPVHIATSEPGKAEAAPVELKEPSIPSPAVEEKPRDVSTVLIQDGIRETRYQLGSSQVIEREVTAGEKVVLYKRVAHHWGQVYYFQDGHPVDERVWKERFGDR